MKKFKEFLSEQESNFEDIELRSSINQMVISRVIESKIKRNATQELIFRILSLLFVWLIITFYVVFSEVIFNFVKLLGIEIQSIAMAVSIILLFNLLHYTWNLFLSFKKTV